MIAPLLFGASPCKPVYIASHQHAHTVSTFGTTTCTPAVVFGLHLPCDESDPNATTLECALESVAE